MESGNGGATDVEEGVPFGSRVEVGDRSDRSDRSGSKLKASEFAQTVIMCFPHAMLPQGHLVNVVFTIDTKSDVVRSP